MEMNKYPIVFEVKQKSSHENYGGKPSSIAVNIFRDNKQMHKYASTHVRYTPEDADATGLCISNSITETTTVTGHLIKEPKIQAATLFLSKEHLSTGIVCHEILHAAIAVYRDNYKADVVLKCGKIKNEEVLCYIYDDLFTQMNLKLHSEGLWK